MKYGRLSSSGLNHIALEHDPTLVFTVFGVDGLGVLFDAYSKYAADVLNVVGISLGLSIGTLEDILPFLNLVFLLDYLIILSMLNIISWKRLWLLLFLWLRLLLDL